MEKINKINLTKKISQDKYIKNIYRYFENFQYELLDEKKYNDYIESQFKYILKNEYNLTEEEINIDKSESTNDNDEGNEKQLRRLSNKETYYGMETIINKKDLFKSNIMGIKIQNQITNEIDPSTGIAVSYIVMTFGNKNIKIKTSEQRTNMHIILEKKNQMIFNLMNLINQSNIDLETRNKNFSAIIIDLENNLLDFYKDNDYSDLFRDSLNLIVDTL